MDGVFWIMIPRLLFLYFLAPFFISNGGGGFEDMFFMYVLGGGIIWLNREGGVEWGD